MPLLCRLISLLLFYNPHTGRHNGECFATGSRHFLASASIGGSWRDWLVVMLSTSYGVINGGGGGAKRNTFLPVTQLSVRAVHQLAIFLRTFRHFSRAGIPVAPDQTSALAHCLANRGTQFVPGCSLGGMDAKFLGSLAAGRSVAASLCRHVCPFTACLWTYWPRLPISLWLAFYFGLPSAAVAAPV